MYCTSIHVHVYSPDDDRCGTGDWAERVCALSDWCTMNDPFADFESMRLSRALSFSVCMKRDDSSSSEEEEAAEAQDDEPV